MAEAVEHTLQQARDAFGRNEWSTAYERFREAGDLQPHDLIMHAESAWWSGHVEETQRIYERAYSAALESGDRSLAANAAIWLCFSFSDKRSPVVMGWLANARRILKDLPACEDHAMLSYADTNIAFSSGKLEDAYAHAKHTEEIGMRIGSRDALALGLFDQGNVLVAMGRVDEGLPLLDEAMVAAVSGDLRPRVTGTIYCSMITTCTRLADYKRAAEWTDAADRWCGRQSITVFPGLCRVYRAAILRLRGIWDRAETEARLAREQIGEVSVFSLAEAFYEIGEIRLRVGDLEAAEESFREAHQIGRDPQPGLALLRLEQGNARAAAAMINRAVAEQSWDRLGRARLLPAQVQIAIADGDLDRARAAADDLGDITGTYSSDALKASSHVANGVISLAAGDAESAVQALRSSVRLWQQVDAPYEAARARLDLARAYQSLNDSAAAELEIAAAAATFEKLGARPDLMRARELERHAADAAAVREQRTFMFTDICRSTDLMEAMGDDAWDELLSWHDAKLRSLFSQHSGEEIKHGGDGFFVAFPDPASALNCAIAIQRALSEHRRAAGFAPQVRIGVHEGQANRRDSDYFGRGVNVAARIGASAGPGEIITSCGTLAATPDRFPTTEQRTLELKGVAGPVDVASVTWR